MGIFQRFKKTADVESAPETLPETAGAPAPTAAPTANASESTASTSQQGGLFARFRQGLRKTSQVLRTDIRDLFRQEGQLVDDEFLSRLFAALVRTDMGGGPATEIREDIQKQFRGRVAQWEEVLEHVKLKLLELTAQAERPIELAEHGPTVVMVVGVNGSGKTTHRPKVV